MSTVSDTRGIPLRDIAITTRLRRHTHQIEALAEDIVNHGLINPITVMDAGGGRFTLIAGLRRLEAMQFLGVDEIRATVLTPMDADTLLQMEYAENEQRQSFTVSERLEYAEKIKEVEKAKAHERKSIYAREGHHQDVDHGPHPEKGRTRDKIAKRVGISSGRQLDRALAVASRRPDLIEKIDSGEITIRGAYQEITEQQRPEESTNANDQSIPAEPATPLPNDQVARAKHDRLMKNPLYSDLYSNHIEAVKGMNRAKGELRFQVEGYQKVIRGHEENHAYMNRMIDRLRAENRELRNRLGLAENEPINFVTTTENGGPPT